MHSKWDRVISALVTWIKNISRVSEAKRERYELIQVTCAEIILSHFESIWWYFSHTFHYFTDEISWKYEKICQSGTWMLPLSFAHVLRSHHVDYVHHTLVTCVLPCASDVRLSLSHIYVRQWGCYHMIRVRCVLRGPLYHMTFLSKGVRIPFSLKTSVDQVWNFSVSIISCSYLSFRPFNKGFYNFLKFTICSIYYCLILCM